MMKKFYRLPSLCERRIFMKWLRDQSGRKKERVGNLIDWAYQRRALVV
jgi:hypothetical protein